MCLFFRLAQTIRTNLNLKKKKKKKTKIKKKKKKKKNPLYISIYENLQL